MRCLDDCPSLRRGMLLATSAKHAIELVTALELEAALSEMTIFQTSMTDPALNIAYYVTGHGLGHATRVVEVCKQLVAAGHNVFVVTAAAASIFTREIPSQQLQVRQAVLDCGSKQQDAFSVDMKGSLELYQEVAVHHRDSILKLEVEWLKASKIDLVTVDIVPIACAAAAAAGLPAVGVSNFSWGE